MGLLQRINDFFTLEKQPPPVFPPWHKKVSRGSHKVRFESNIDKLMKMVEGVNGIYFDNYKIEVDGYSFFFSRVQWVDVEVYGPEGWLVRTKFTDIFKYNILRLDEAKTYTEEWWRLANATDSAIAELIRRDEEEQAKRAMKAMLK